MHPRSGLVSLLGQVPDPRDPRGVRHALPVLLAVGLAAVLGGARSFVAIGEWVAEASTQMLAELGASRPARPSESAIRRAFTRVDPDVLDMVIGAFCWTRTQVVDGRRVIALDGKTVRGARTPTQTAPHLIAAFDHTAGTVLSQVATAAKSNEIPAVRALLRLFDLNRVVVTVDAMHTQSDTAEPIVSQGGDYVFTVKSNQPSLFAACKNLPWAQVHSHSTLSSGHGRRARRTIKVVAAPAWITFAHTAQVAQIRRTVTRAGRRSVEVVYIITSAQHRVAPPATLASWVRRHWGIENSLHWVRDVTFNEDRSQVRTASAPRVMATLRSTAISLLRLAGWTAIATALRHHARDPNRAITLLLTC
jgi:predicted transposase YbfD/YdcC